ncbi:hypothetical protein Ptr86124_013752 [Pyrenophora tritici-repentis]|uniref:Uncharacterized protein n=1 Tax=Pyrenophora tritici-repentis TaxID=45151 RepID=A0A922N0T1_9PLEO|nr:hypothetical protein Ptr86124_013752 [Pyrenophora tritici-repentis]
MARNSYGKMYTPLSLARSLNILEEWSLILRESGYYSENVFLKDLRRRKRASRLQFATRSRIDNSALELPSFDGLRCRLCRKAYCKNPEHLHGTFDQNKPGNPD